jgi:hypothetical protein
MKQNKKKTKTHLGTITSSWRNGHFLDVIILPRVGGVMELRSTFCVHIVS